MFKLVRSTPADGASLVRLVPGRITLDFIGDVDRAAVEAGLTLVGTPDARTFYRWNGLQLEVLLDRPFHHWRDHTLTVPITGGTATVRWKTRATLGDYPPANAVTGASRRGLGPGAYKRAIVLSGGGAKGAFQVGALKYLYTREGFFPDLVVGTSVGAINGAKLAEATSVPEHLATIAQLEQFWLTLLDDRDCIEPNPHFVALGGVADGNVAVGLSGVETVGVGLASLIPIFGTLIAGAVIADKVEDAIENVLRHVDRLDQAAALYDLGPLRRVIERRLDLAKVAASAVELRMGAVDLFTGRTIYFDKTDGGLVSNILGSAAIPVVFPAERISLNHRPAVFVDGGLRVVCGLDEAIRAGANDIVVIPTYQGDPNRPRWHDDRYARGTAIGERAFDLAYDEIMERDVDSVRRYELLLAERAGRDLRIRVIDPELELHGGTQFHPEAIRRQIGYGFERAAQVLGDGRGTRPNPIWRTRTANLLVIEPTFDGGQPVRDDRATRSTNGGLGDHWDVRRMPSLRIRARFDGAAGPAYPSDGLWSYADVAVPGSDPDGEGLDPYLKKDRRGLIYALPLHAPAGQTCEVDVVLSWCRGVPRGPSFNPTQPAAPPIDWQPYEERRVTVPVTLAYDGQGVQRVTVKLPVAAAAVGATSRACVLLPQGPSPTPAFTIHGTGEIADLAALTTQDGPLAGGRYEVSRDPQLVRWTDRGDGMTAIGLTECEVWATWASVELFAEPSFKGRSRKLQGAAHSAGHRAPYREPLGFAVRSIRVTQIDPTGPLA